MQQKERSQTKNDEKGESGRPSGEVSPKLFLCRLLTYSWLLHRRSRHLSDTFYRMRRLCVLVVALVLLALPLLTPSRASSAFAPFDSFLGDNTTIECPPGKRVNATQLGLKARFYVNDASRSLFVSSFSSRRSRPGFYFFLLFLRSSGHLILFEKQGEDSREDSSSFPPPSSFLHPLINYS